MVQYLNHSNLFSVSIDDAGRNVPSFLTLEKQGQYEVDFFHSHRAIIFLNGIVEW